VTGFPELRPAQPGRGWPAANVAVLSLGVLCEDALIALIALIGVVLGAAGIALEVFLAAIIIHAAGHLISGPGRPAGCAQPSPEAVRVGDGPGVAGARRAGVRAFTAEASEYSRRQRRGTPTSNSATRRRGLLVICGNSRARFG